jgi:hypothetical protein
MWLDTTLYSFALLVCELVSHPLFAQAGTILAHLYPELKSNEQFTHDRNLRLDMLYRIGLTAVIQPYRTATLYSYLKCIHESRIIRHDHCISPIFLCTSLNTFNIDTLYHASRTSNMYSTTKNYTQYKDVVFLLYEDGLS